MPGIVQVSIVPNEHEDQLDLGNAHFPLIDTNHIEGDNLYRKQICNQKKTPSLGVGTGRKQNLSSQKKQ